MTIKEKILSYLETTGRVKAEFYKALGVSPSNFKGAGKNSALSGDTIALILQLYPDLSPDWLLNGVGEMLRTDNNATATSSLQSSSILGDKLLTMINDREATIRLQAEEIGQLKERIRQLEQRLGKDAASVNTAITANVG